MNKFKASYYGFLIGDAMGVYVESYERDVLIESPVVEMLGHGSYDVPAGSWSDDGSMMMATMDSICAMEGIDYNDMADKLLQWISYGQYTSTGLVFGAGGACLKSLERYQRGAKALEAGMEGVNYNGNEALSRMLPIVFYAKVMELPESEIIDLVCDVASLTHRHEINLMGCYIYVRYALFLLEGFDKFVSYQKLKNLDYSAFSDEAIKVYRRILYDDIINYPLSEISSSGYVVDTLEAVIWCVNNTEGFKQSVIGAINLGGDAGTIGALVSALTGIIYGYNEIPEKWINGLQKPDYLKLMCHAFVKTLNNLR